MTRCQLSKVLHQQIDHQQRTAKWLKENPPVYETKDEAMDEKQPQRCASYAPRYVPRLRTITTTSQSAVKKTTNTTTRSQTEGDRSISTASSHTTEDAAATTPSAVKAVACKGRPERSIGGSQA